MKSLTNSTESYWHFNNIAYDWIIPEHIFITIGYSNWNTWNPVFYPADLNIVCGPFTLTDFDPVELYELSVYQDYHYYQDFKGPSLSESTSNQYYNSPSLSNCYIIDNDGCHSIHF